MPRVPLSPLPILCRRGVNRELTIADKYVTGGTVAGDRSLRARQGLFWHQHILLLLSFTPPIGSSLSIGSIYRWIIYRSSTSLAAVASDCAGSACYSGTYPTQETFAVCK